MKKWIGMLLAVVLTAGALAGCGDSKKDHPLGLYLGDKLMVEIGMDKETVDRNFREAGLGEGTVNYLGMNMYAEEKIFLDFGKNRVTYISCESPLFTDSLSVKIGKEMGIANAKEKYRKDEIITGIQSFIIGYDIKQKVLKNIENYENIPQHPELIFSKAYEYDSNQLGVISCISMGIKPDETDSTDYLF